ncbi:response regulator transcription factor [Streptomyces sp. B1866]|uniref:response regulator n=1 Tax=Streptomyces sp. B1866 TaxID=3075431 RepID=UPI00288D5EA3|nr:response regulator transcription factor [Streptomyces sp. B1866]MDT3397384.1 response regulator transcription factor [Streptomyces sp. B1866]
MSTATAGPARLTVLVCDDDPMIRDALCDVLREEPDLEVVAVARDADEAIALAARHAPAIAVLDVRMPGGGAHAARGIRKRSPGTRILTFSAYTDIGAREEMRRAGVTEYLLKGVPNTEIVAAVRRVGHSGPAA